MKLNSSLLLLSLVACAAWPVPPASAQSIPPRILVPDTTVPLPQDVGVRAHTNHLIFNHRVYRPNGGLGPNGGMDPAQICSFYGVPVSSLGVPTGGSGVIAIVDAYHYPTALNDFNVFSAQFGLPQETSTNATASGNQVFQVVYANGSKPRTNGGWAQEEALDIEWAHAMAPNAKIVLVEAASNSFSNLFAAIDVAKAITGATQVSMSWGGGEFSGETSYDSHFTTSGGTVAFFASSGDSGGVVEYPSCSPNVVAAGGTSVQTDGQGNYLGETAWSGSGGGNSAYEPRPSYQVGVAGTGSRRSVPDVAADADPNTGVAVYDSTSYQGLSGWLVFGGTSVASPCLAGIANAAAHTGSTSSLTELNQIYSELTGTSYANYFHDITSGSAGSFTAGTGWDFITGAGSPKAASSL